MSDESKFKEAIDTLNRQREASGVNVNGKLYSMVKDRVETFRRTFGSEYGIDTQVDYASGGFSPGNVITCVAKIIDRNGVVLASGHAMETVGSFAAPVEACETSAIGRALAVFGLHGGEFASDAEMTAVPRKQETLVQTQKEQPAPPQMDDKFIVPSEHDAQWTDLIALTGHVVESVGRIGDVNMLGKYWSALHWFRGFIGTKNPDLHEQLKGAFTARKNELNQGDHHE